MYLFRRATQIHFPENPLYIHYGKGAYLYDENGKGYLDLMNNVAHGKHSFHFKLRSSICYITFLKKNYRKLLHLCLYFFLFLNSLRGCFKAAFCPL